MDINFFNPKYHTEQPRNDASFGLSDDNRLAFTTTDKSVSIAKVCNPHRVKIQFVPLDHNIIIKDTQGKDISMCDAMIYTPEKSPKKDIYFIEIKEQMANWLPKAISQLGSTIQIFSQNHILTDFSHRTATAANKNHPYFQHSHKERCQAFRAKFGFRLNICERVDIKP